MIIVIRRLSLLFIFFFSLDVYVFLQKKENECYSAAIWGIGFICSYLHLYAINIGFLFCTQNFDFKIIRKCWDYRAFLRKNLRYLRGWWILCFWTSTGLRNIVNSSTFGLLFSPTSNIHLFFLLQFVKKFIFYVVKQAGIF